VWIREVITELEREVVLARTWAELFSVTPLTLHHCPDARSTPHFRFYIASDIPAANISAAATTQKHVKFVRLPFRH
jgi:hypothetical protein